MMSMGSVKSVAIKTLGEEILTQNRERFGRDFTKNKKALQEIRPIKSKRVRNTVAGYITHRMRK